MRFPWAEGGRRAEADVGAAHDRWWVESGQLLQDPVSWLLFYVQWEIIGGIYAKEQ